jgi:hypothetical protein
MRTALEAAFVLLGVFGAAPEASAQPVYGVGVVTARGLAVPVACWQPGDPLPDPLYRDSVDDSLNERRAAACTARLAPPSAGAPRRTWCLRHATTSGFPVSADAGAVVLWPPGLPWAEPEAADAGLPAEAAAMYQLEGAEDLVVVRRLVGRFALDLYGGPDGGRVSPASADPLDVLQQVSFAQGGKRETVVMLLRGGTTAYKVNATALLGATDVDGDGVLEVLVAQTNGKSTAYELRSLRPEPIRFSNACYYLTVGRAADCANAAVEVIGPRAATPAPTEVQRWLAAQLPGATVVDGGLTTVERDGGVGLVLELGVKALPVDGGVLVAFAVRRSDGETEKATLRVLLISRNGVVLASAEDGLVDPIIPAFTVTALEPVVGTSRAALLTYQTTSDRSYVRAIGVSSSARGVTVSKALQLDNFERPSYGTLTHVQQEVLGEVRLDGEVVSAHYRHRSLSRDADGAVVLVSLDFRDAWWALLTLPP